MIRGQPRGGPPPERTLALSNITAPKLARRADAPKDEVRIFQCDLRVHPDCVVLGNMSGQPTRPATEPGV